MIEELDVVALKRDRPDLGLKAGEEGAVVMVYEGAYEVEFVNDDGTTRVMTALKADEVEVTWRIADHRAELSRAAG